MNQAKLRLLTCLFVLVPFAMPPSAPAARPSVDAAASATEAPAGFDNHTNNAVDQPTFDAGLAAFATAEDDDEGIGPVYNARSCAECHGNPVVGGNSQTLELRAGHFDGTNFVDHPGGSLIHSRAIDALMQETILDNNEVRTFRGSTSILGLGFVEAIDDSTLIAIGNFELFQSAGLIYGQPIYVPIAEAPGATRVGRFGWKCQQASLLSFSADAYLNEMGITTPLAPIENTSNGHSIDGFDLVPLGHPNDPDDADNDDLEHFTDFMRGTKVPPRGPSSPESVAGANVFTQIGCAICHTASITTAHTGTLMNGGTFQVPPALGDKIIHPYSDFLLHNIGTGDGIVQNGGPVSRNKIRTMPLWGLRTRNRFMHDGASLALVDAINRHNGEAFFIANNFRHLSTTQRNQVLAFLRSL